MKREKSDGTYFIWSASILICLVLAVFALFFASCADGESESPEPSPSQEAVSPSPATGDPDTSAPPSEAPETDGPAGPSGNVELSESEDMGQEYIDKFVFLGDSTTYGLAHYEIVNRNQVWTPNNGTLTLDRWAIDRIFYPDDDEEIFITEAVTKTRPEYLLITLGINGVSYMKEDTFTMNYKDLIAAIKEASPDTKIILNSIYPVGANYDKNSGINNEKIAAANVWVRTIAEESGVKFLDTASILKDAEGNMKAGYDNGDNIHPNGDTYKLIIDYIRTHGYV